MKIEQSRATQLRVEFHAVELATLITAARWIAEGCPGELPSEVVDQARQVVKNYDEAWRTRAAAGSPQ